VSPRAKPKDTLTPLELEIMQVLWDAGPGAVAEVQARLPSELAYTTVQTMLNVLLRKKKVKRTLVGRAFRYAPAVSREGAIDTAISDLVTRMFGGSGEALLMALIDTHRVTAEEVERAARLLAKTEEGK
jgi:BlaI family penicillinase repressor